MEEPTATFGHKAATPKEFARRLLTIGENQLEPLTLEAHEELELLLHAFVLALGVAAFGLLAGLALTAAIVLLLWAYSPVAVLLTLSGLYGAAGVWLCRRLNGLLIDWQMFSTSIDQLQKDRECLEEILAWTRSNCGNSF